MRHRNWTLVEPCAGSAAFSMHMLGAKRAIVPYQGSKWRYRRDLQWVAASLGFEGAPDRVILADPGPWGLVHKELSQNLEGVILELRLLAICHQRNYYDYLKGKPLHENETKRAAELLFLQRLAFSGKAVSDVGGVWKPPGFNKSSANGIPATEKFGAVKPMVPSMIRALQGYRSVRLNRIESYKIGGLAPTILSIDLRPGLIYIDPPYQSSTGYPGGTMSRADVIALAQAWHAMGYTVIVSESEPLPLGLTVRHEILAQRVGRIHGKAKVSEYISILEAPI